MKSLRAYIELHSYKILCVFIVLFVSYFSYVGFSRHDNFYSRRLDLGNMDQTVWNVLHGNGFSLTDPMGVHQVSRLAVHADFILILLAPFYLLWSDPKMLIFLQALITGLGAIPVYWIARDTLKSKKIGLLFAVLFLLYPPSERKMLHDFHAVSLSTTFLFFAYWFMQKEKYVYFLLFGILAALGKEQIWVTFGFMGAYIAFIKKKYTFGIFTALVGFAGFYFLMWYAIPAVTFAKQHFALVYLSEFGENQNQIIRNMLLNPLGIAKTMVLPDRLAYYFQLLFPVGFLSLLSPLYFLFAAPSILINTLSNNNLMRQIDYQYSSTITPFTFIAAIEGYKVALRLVQHLITKKILSLNTYVVAGWISVTLCISVLLWGELPVGRNSRFYFFTTSLPEKKIMKEIASHIDSKYSVSATNNIGAHFSQRQFLYNFPINALVADYSIVYLGDPYSWPSAEAQRETVQTLLASPAYEVIARDGNFYAFKKRKL